MVAPAETPVAGPSLAEAEELFRFGQLVQARQQLEELEAGGARSSQINFLFGLVAAAQQDYREAIARFRRILVTEPNAVRVRLELGRVYFEKRDYRNAERQFLFARSGQIPDAVRKRIDGFLGAIRRNRTLDIGLTVAVAPDTNVNAGPSSSTVLLFGLPFQLSPEARQRSGVGGAIAGYLIWSPHLSRIWRWDAGVVGDGRFYGRGASNDAGLTAITGPHIVLDRLEARLNGRLTRRWFGDAVFFDAYGGSLDATWYLSERTGIVGTVTALRYDYPRLPFQNGVTEDYSLGAFHALTTSSLGRLTVAVGRVGAEAPGFANRNIGFDLRYLQEFGAGFTLSLNTRYRHFRFDERLPAFDRRRDDNQVVAQVTMLNRRLSWHGFSPTLIVTYTRNASNLSLYDFERTQVEAGVTRVF